MTEQSGKKKKATVAAAAVTALALLFTGTFAWVSTAQSAINRFVKTDYQVVLHDKFDGVDVEDGKSHKVEFDAGDTVNKDIWVENAGSDNIIVRVKLTENMSIKQNNGTAQTIGTANAAHNLTDSATPTYGDACAAIHEHVTWTSGNVITYDEWAARDGATAGQEKKGAFWVVAPDGWAYWMQPLAPSDPTVTGDNIQPGTTAGHTGLLLDAVKLNESETGHMDYSIKAEMDAIDVGLAGLAQDGATWTSNEAKVLASYVSGDTYAQAAAQAKADVEKATAEAEALRQEADELASSETATEEEKQAAVAAAEAAEKKAENLAGAAEAGAAYQEAIARGDNEEAEEKALFVEAYTEAAKNGGTVDTTCRDSEGTPYTTLTVGDKVSLVYMGVPADGIVTIPEGIDVIGVDKKDLTHKSIFGTERLNVRKLIIPEGVTVLGQMSLGILEKVESIELPNSLTTIRPYALENAGAKTAKGVTINLPENLKEIDRAAFENCYFANDITVPKSVTTISNFLFNNVRGKNITLSEGVKTIEIHWGYGFHAMKLDGSLIIPSTVTELKSGTFFDSTYDILYLPENFKDYDFKKTSNVPKNATIKFYSGSSEGGVQDSQVTSTVVYKDSKIVTE